jgi:hypothetical protein
MILLCDECYELGEQMIVQTMHGEVTVKGSWGSDHR